MSRAYGGENPVTKCTSATPFDVITFQVCKMYNAF